MIALIIPLSIPILLSSCSPCFYIDRNIEDCELLSRIICLERIDLVEFLPRQTGIRKHQVRRVRYKRTQPVFRKCLKQQILEPKFVLEEKIGSLDSVNSY